MEKVTPVLGDHRSIFERQFFENSTTYIHPTAIVGPHVTLDEGAKIGPHCIVIGTVHIGARSRLHAYVSVGFPAQDVGTTEPLGTIHIGTDVNIREFVTIHSSKKPDGQTFIGDRCYIMNYSHVSHDVQLEHDVILINSVNLGGHVHVGHHAMLMAGSALHQSCRVGPYTSLAPYSGARQDLPPFSLMTGKPAAYAGLNRVGLRRAGFGPDAIHAIKQAAKLWFHDKLALENLRAQASTEPWGQDIHVQEFLQFITQSNRGVSRRSIADISATAAEGEF